jgi:hypothetical protein
LPLWSSETIQFGAPDAHDCALGGNLFLEALPV